MSGFHQFDRITSKLNQNLTANRFKINTNWFVITGVACTGKTTLINMLEENNFVTYPETARAFFDSEMAIGRPLESILSDGKNTQRRILENQLELERGIPPEQFAFLDRAIPDSLSHFRIFGMDPNEIVSECIHFRYRVVFILDRLALQREKQLGPEDDASSDFLDEWLYKDYRALGYDVIRVPPLAPEARLSFVLEQVGRFKD